MQLVPFARFTSDGQYIQTGLISSDSSILQDPDVYVGEANRLTQYHTEAGPVDMPPRPSTDHFFDYSVKEWTVNEEVIRARLRIAIEQERDARIFAPIIIYDGKNLDADALSIERLANKLAALDAYEKVGLEMPAPMLVWRDADNVTHAFATHLEYKTWLAGFAVALDLRGTQAFAWSWLKKSELDGITTVEDLLAFDPTT